MQGNVVIELPGTDELWSEKAEDLAQGVCKINADDASCECGTDASCIKPFGGDTFTSGGCREVKVTIPKGMKFSAFGLGGGGFSCTKDMPAQSGCYAKGGTRELEACSASHDDKCDSWRYQNADDYICNFEAEPMSGTFSACAYYFEACEDGDCHTDRDCEYDIAYRRIVKLQSDNTKLRTENKGLRKKMMPALLKGLKEKMMEPELLLDQERSTKGKASRRRDIL